jgi:hypothetical protein
MADLRDFTGKNRKFTGTIGERISTGSTAQRDDAAFGAGTLRFNTSTALMEYYTGTEWKSIDAPPAITSFEIDGGGIVTNSFIPTGTSSNITIEINGILFDVVNATVLFEGTAGGDVSPITTVRNSSSLITVTVNANLFNNTFEPYSIKVTNGSGLSATLENCLVADTAPVFATASGTLGTIFDSTRSSYTLSSAAATDADGDTITYSITSGSLPPGLSISSSTGAITGTASAVGTNTTSTFTVSAATANATSTRSFSITVNAPAITSFTSSSGTFSVPSGVTSLDVLVIAGGGGGGGAIQTNTKGGGGGAGGLIFRPGFPVTPGGSIPYSIGSGGPGGPAANSGTQGTDTTFGTLTAKGGGWGGGWNNESSAAQPGGSAGAKTTNDTTTSYGPGTGTQPSQPGDSGTFGFGNPSGVASPNNREMNVASGAGGGGGAGGSGQAGGNGPGGAGGIGRTYSISGSSTAFAGGGGGGGHNSGGPAVAGGAPGASGNSSAPASAVANRGGGGGGASIQMGGGTSNGSPGASGIVIVSI